MFMHDFYISLFITNSLSRDGVKYSPRNGNIYKLFSLIRLVKEVNVT